MLKNNWKSLLFFLGLVAFIALAGSQATMPAVESWYQQIAKPSWNPPQSVFGPVWTVLYIFIGISGWLVFKRLYITHGQQALLTPALSVYWVQLIFNFAWSFIFFGAKEFGLALIDITLLLITILITIRAFMKIEKKAAILLIPYALWVFYALTINAEIVRLNGWSL